MKAINKTHFKKKSYNTLRRKNSLNEIHHHLEEFSNHKIPIEECLAKTGALTADLISDHFSDLRISRKAYDNLLTMIINYYTLLHIDKFMADFTVDKNYAYDQVDRVSKEVLSEASKSSKFKTYDFNTIDRISKDFLQQLVDVYYLNGTQGCLNYLVSSIYTVIRLENNNSSFSKHNIEEIIRSVQAEKFLDLLHPDLHAWS